jgi:hypothetical protein
MRVPTSSTVILSDQQGVKVRASAVNISAGGLCITAPQYPLDLQEYQIQIDTPTHGEIHFSGFPVYQNKTVFGLKITLIAKAHLQTIHQIVESFQLSDDFINSIEEKDIIQDWLVDKAGDDIEIIFETEDEKTDRSKMS